MSQKEVCWTHTSPRIATAWPGLAHPQTRLSGAAQGFATLATFSKKHDGFPFASVVGFAVDAAGKPFFCFSGMSVHTQNLLANPKARTPLPSRRSPCRVPCCSLNRVQQFLTFEN